MNKPVKDVIIIRPRFPSAFIECIAEKHGISIDEARKAMRYNVLTIQQFCLVTGCNASDIYRYCRPRKRKLRTEEAPILTMCEPFGETHQKFIGLDSEARQMIKKRCGYREGEPGKAAIYEG